jgi:hypothetical protein
MFVPAESTQILGVGDKHMKMVILWHYLASICVSIENGLCLKRATEAFGK